jgi:hypothetical protein
MTSSKGRGSAGAEGSFGTHDKTGAESPDNLKAMTDKTNMIIGDNKKNIDAMLESFRNTAQNQKETADDVKKHPWKLLRKP